MKNKSIVLLISIVTCFIVGNIVGAGILGLPINTGLTGFIPTIIGMILVSGAMLFTAHVLAGEAIRSKKEFFHYPSLYQNYLGSTGKWIAVIANLIILYGFITVYLAGSTTIISNLLHVKVPNIVILLIFFVIVTGLTIAKPKALMDYTALFVVLLAVFFVIMVIMSMKYVKPERLTYTDWRFMPVTIPIIITTLSFHNIIPNICRDMKWNSRNVLIAMIAGSIVAYVVCIIWNYVTMGSLPLNGDVSLIGALQTNLPATIPMAEVIHSPLYITSSLLFALLAIITSYLTNGNGLMEFLEDLTKNYFKISNKAFIVALAFGPPLIITIVYPNIFLKALNFVGGIGIVILFGILPSIIAILRVRPSRKKMAFGVFMTALFTLFLFFEFGQKFDLFRIKPGIDYQKYNFTYYSLKHPSYAIMQQARVLPLQKQKGLRGVHPQRRIIDQKR